MSFLKTIQRNLNKKKVLLPPYNTDSKSLVTSAYRFLTRSQLENNILREKNNFMGEK